MTIKLDSPGTSLMPHSADVRMNLHIGDQSFPVLQARKIALKVRDVDKVKPGDAVFEISVDGDVRRYPIRILANRWKGQWIAIEDR